MATKQFNIRVPEEIYDAVRKKVKSQGISVSEFVRDIVAKAIGVEEAASDETVVWLRDELQQRNEEVKALRTSQSEERQRHDTIVLQMAKQLESTQHRLEDLSNPKGKWWERKKRSG